MCNHFQYYINRAVQENAYSFVYIRVLATDCRYRVVLLLKGCVCQTHFYNRHPTCSFPPPPRPDLLPVLSSCSRMARIASRVVLGTLVVWLMATTLVPTYLLLSGRYSVVRISGVDADPMDSVMSRVKRQQGVREGENGVYSWDTDGSESHPPPLQSELDKVVY